MHFYSFLTKRKCTQNLGKLLKNKMQRSLLQRLTSGNKEQKSGKNYNAENSDDVVLNGSYFLDLHFLHQLKY